MQRIVGTIIVALALVASACSKDPFTPSEWAAGRVCEFHTLPYSGQTRQGGEGLLLCSDGFIRTNAQITVEHGNP